MILKRLLFGISKRTMAIDIGGMRKPYLGENQAFEVKDLVAKEPFAQFQNWFDQAKETPGIEEANAMCVASASKAGIPSARYVLLKAYGPPTDTTKGGFVFYTNYDSRKGKELIENPFAALVFYWEPLKRSVRIEGSVEKVTEEESTAYFESRPIGSQIGAAISNQSTKIPDRQFLLDKETQLKEEFKEKKMEKPSFWGGFRVVPNSFEFWQGQSTRIHDRIVFRRKTEGEEIDEKLTIQGDQDWLIERLSP